MKHSNKIFNTITKITVVLFSFFCSTFYGQTTIVSEPFSSSIPSAPAAWTSDASSWTLNYNYAGNDHTPNNYCARILNGVYDKYFYIPITIKQNYSYNIDFWVKNVTDIKLVFNETADLVTPLNTQTKTAVCSNTSWTHITTWTQYTHGAANTSGYVMVCLQNSTYGSSTAYIDDITITETPPACSYPNTQATMNAYTGVGSNSITVNWTRGNGNKILVVAKKSASVLSDPTDGGSYTANSAFGSGSQIGTGNYVVNDGTGTSVTVTELDASTTYDFHVYEYNTTGPCYKVAGATSSQATTRSTKYYVNDATYNASDTYSTAVGNNSNVGQRPSVPKLNLANVLSTYSGTFLAGDTIFVDAGTFSENDLTSPSGGVVINGQGMTKTTFAKSGSDHYFMTITVNNTTFRDFKVTGYDNTTASSTGRGIDVNGATGVNIINVQVDGNGNSSGAYPIEVRNNATVTFNGGGTTCNNTWTNAGGVHITGATSNVTIQNYSFIGNQRSGQAGAALRMENGTVNIYNSLFKSNTTYNSIMASAVYQLAGTLNIYSCSFDANQYDAIVNDYGGTIKIAGGTFKIKYSKIINNTNSNASVAYGAGIGLTAGSATVDSCTFSGNVGSRGNDINVSGGNLTTTNCTFSSGANQIGISGGSFTITDSGSPSEYGAGIVHTNTNAPSYTTDPSIPSFTGSCATTIAILPIELTKFIGECNNNQVILMWQTDSEKNNNFFSVERSNDGENFTTIGTIKGAGNSSQTLNYSFVDEEKLEGITYYRLSQEDYDGTDSRSKIIAVEHLCAENEDSEISVYPNPSLSNFMLDIKLYKDSRISYEMYNILGSIVKSKENQLYQLGLQSIDIDMNDLRSGIYYINVTINKKKYSLKFIKL